MDFFTKIAQDIRVFLLEKNQEKFKHIYVCCSLKHIKLLCVLDEQLYLQGEVRDNLYRKKCELKDEYSDYTSVDFIFMGYKEGNINYDAILADGYIEVSEF